jgi:hypothetical protein
VSILIVDTGRVTAAQSRVDRLVNDLVALGRRGLPRAEYYREAGARLRRVVDSDALCWHTLDPETLLMTSDEPEELIGIGLLTPETAPAAGQLIVAGEYMGDGINTFAGLARRRVPVAILG